MSTMKKTAKTKKKMPTKRPLKRAASAARQKVETVIAPPFDGPRGEEQLSALRRRIVEATALADRSEVRELPVSVLEAQAVIAKFWNGINRQHEKRNEAALKDRRNALDAILFARTPQEALAIVEELERKRCGATKRE